MRRLDVKEFIERYVTRVPVYPSNFPSHIDNVIMFEFSGNVDRGQQVSGAQLVLYTRATSMGEAETIALDARDSLKDITNVYIGDTHVILLKAIGKTVDYGGNDDNGREYFVSRFTMLLDDKEQI